MPRLAADFGGKCVTPAHLSSLWDGERVLGWDKPCPTPLGKLFHDGMAHCQAAGNDGVR